jgi:hypothetical protein
VVHVSRLMGWDELSVSGVPHYTATRYNLPMRFTAASVVIVFVLAAAGLAPSRAGSQPQPRSATVPIKLDHNRVVIDVEIPLRDGTTQRVRAWVDNGNPDLYMSQRLAELIGGTISCDGQLCSATPPVEMNIGGMTIPLGGRIPGAGIKEAKVPAGHAPIAPGLEAEINIPSTVLRGYEVLINFPDHEFTIAQPGTLKFNGVKAKVIVNGANGLIQVPSQIENKKYNLGLDLGSPISFLSDELFDKLSAAHPERPHMIGAVGPANISGERDELSCKLMRVERMQYGPLYFTNVAMVDFARDCMASFEKRAGISTVGLIGVNALVNYRIGFDYARSAVYFDIGRLFNFPAFDVIGLILKPEDDGRFTIVGIADFEGKPSVPQGEDGVQAGDHLVGVNGIPVAGSTLGQVWSMLGGEPGKERGLTVERGGKSFIVAARVQHFLGDVPAGDESKKQSEKN